MAHNDPANRDPHAPLQAPVDDAEPSAERWLTHVGDRVRAPMARLLAAALELRDEQLSAPQQQRVAEIVAGAEVSLAHLDDLLDYLRLEAGALALHQLGFDLRVLAQGVVRDLAMAAAESGVPLSIRIAPQVPALVSGDPGRLRQVLTVLIADRLRQGNTGPLALKLELLQERGREVVLRFAMEGAVPSQGERPTGLGRVISSNLVSMMGGSTGHEVASSGALVTWFTVTLRRRTVPAESSAEAIRDIVGARVLVLASDATLRSATRHQLESWGCLPSVVLNVTGALAKLRQAAEAGSPYELVLVALDGDEQAVESFGKRVRADEALSQTRLVVLAQAPRRGDAAAKQASGYVGYLPQSTPPDDLKRCLVAVRSGGDDAGLVTRHLLVERRKQSFRILLVDNDFQQGTTTLAAVERLGYRVELVSTVQQAQTLLRVSQWNLVLASMGLPDGGAATLAGWIQAPEGLGGAAQPSVVVLQAAGQAEPPAMAPGVRVVHRPADVGALDQLLDRLLDGRPTSPATRSGSWPSLGLVDRADLLERLGGDEQLYDEVLRSFVDAAPPWAESLRRATDSGDVLAVRQAAQTLMDAAANVSANGVRELARRIIGLSETDALDEVPGLVDQIEAQIESLDAQLSRR